MTALTRIRCVPLDQTERCEKPARWYVWHAGCGNAYTYCCDEHLYERIKQCREQAEVVCAKLVPWYHKTAQQPDEEPDFSLYDRLFLKEDDTARLWALCDEMEKLAQRVTEIEKTLVKIKRGPVYHDVEQYYKE